MAKTRKIKTFFDYIIDIIALKRLYLPHTKFFYREPNRCNYITINNLKGAESGVLRKDGKVVDISLANCYTLEDVVRELVFLLAKQE